jgi:hypothetical protein
MAVWPATLDRAVSFLSQFCYAAEEAGYEVSCGDRIQRRAALVLGRDRIPFTLNESYARPSRPLSDEEWNALAPHQRMFRTKREYRYVASGCLELKVEGVWMEGEKGRFNDKADKPLEGQITDIMAIVAWQVSALREIEAERERAKATVVAAEARRLTEAEIKKREKDRLAFLVEKAEAFDEAERLSDFIAYLEQVVTGTQSPQTAALLEWASAHVRALRNACSIARLEKDIAWSGLFK